MQDDSQNTRKFWTKNRISILIPWMMPLVLSILVALYDVRLALISFVLFSVIAWVVINLRSPFANDSADSPKFKEGMELPDGSILSGKEIRKTRYWMIFFGVISFVSLYFALDLLPILFPSMITPIEPLLVFSGVVSFFIFIFQCLSKTYLIVRDLPLNGFPFFISNSRIRNNSEDPEFFRNSNTDTYSSYGTTNVTSPFHILNRNR